MAPQTQELYSKLLIYAASLHAENKTTYEIRDALKEKGLPEDLCDTIIDQSQELYRNLIRKKANKNMLWGAVWFGGGLLVTVATYSSSGGGHYVLAYGAIIGGLIQLISGLIQYSKI